MLYVRDYHSASLWIPSPPYLTFASGLKKRAELLYTPLQVFFILDPVSTHFPHYLSLWVISLSSAYKQANASFKILPWPSYPLRYNPVSNITLLKGYSHVQPSWSYTQLLHFSLSSFQSHYSELLSLVSDSLLVHYHFLVLLLLTFLHHQALLIFHSLKLFSGFLWQNTFLAPSPPLLLLLYLSSLPNKRRNYPKSMTFTLSLHILSSLATVWLHLSPPSSSPFIFTAQPESTPGCPTGTSWIWGKEIQEGEVKDASRELSLVHKLPLQQWEPWTGARFGR